MRTGKQIFSFVLVIIMLLGMFPVTVYAENNNGAIVTEESGDNSAIAVSEGVEVYLADGYSTGGNLVSLSYSGHSISFSPVPAPVTVIKAEDNAGIGENEADEAENSEPSVEESTAPTEAPEESAEAEKTTESIESSEPSPSPEEATAQEEYAAAQPPGTNAAADESVSGQAGNGAESEAQTMEAAAQLVAGYAESGTIQAYPCAFNEKTDIAIERITNGIKIGVTLREYTTTELSFLFEFGDLTPAVSGNAVTLYDASGNTAATIAAPYICAADGNSGCNISAVMGSLGAGQYKLTYYFDGAWLESASYSATLNFSVEYAVSGTTGRRIMRAPTTHTHDYHIGSPISSSAGSCTERTWALYQCDCGVTYTWYGGYAAHNYSTSYYEYSRFQHSKVDRCVVCGTQSVSYETHADNNNDNICDRCGFEFYLDPNDANLQVTAHGNDLNSCTGYLELTWSAVSEATTYYVAIFNGEVYEYINVGNVTSWSTQGKGIWPTDDEISNGKYKLHTSGGGGAELNAIPALAYKNAGTSHASDINYYVSVIPANARGYVNQPPASAVKSARLPDTIPPSQASTLTTELGEYTNTDSVELKWSGIEDYNGSSGSRVTSLGTGAVQYRADDSETWLSTDSSAGTGSYTLDISAWAEGTHVIHLRAVDSAGNTSTIQSVTLKIDRTAPTAPSIAVTPDDWNRFDTAKLTWSGISDLFDLARVEYSFDGGAYTDSGSTAKENTDYTLDLSALSEGEHILSVRAVDLAGNVGEASSLTIKRDTAAPTAEDISISPDSWTNGDEIALSWEKLSDATSGVREAYYTLDGGEKQTLEKSEAFAENLSIAGLEDGKHKLLLCFEDYAGNVAEHEFFIYRDVSDPAITLLSPADGNAVNGIVEIWGTVKDISIKQWKVTATGSDGDERVLASGSSEADAERMAVLNCAGYDDGEPVELKISAEDKAGNSSSVSGTVIIVDKSAAPLAGSVKVTVPADREVIDEASIEGSYSRESEDSEEKGLLYIDGEYVGDCTGGSFPFDAITYTEGSMHSISVLSCANSGGVGFSQGLSSLVLLSDAFENEEYLSSASGVTLGNGASANGGSGMLVSQPVSISYPILALRLNVTADGGDSIQYYYSTDSGSSWSEIAPNTDVPLLTRIDNIQIKAVLNGSAVLYGWTLQGVIETSPTKVIVKLLRPVENIKLSDTTVTKAITELADAPESAKLQRLYKDGEKIAENFNYDVRTIADGTSCKISLLAETEDGIIYGSGAEAATLLRENVGAKGTTDSAALSLNGDIYAVRVDALSSGTGAYYYSADGSNWIKLTLGEYTVLDKAASKIYVKAEMGTSTLIAWHVEGVSCKSSRVNTQILQKPVNVSAADWGEDYYANEKLRKYELTWTDPNPADSSAANSTVYEIYRNGVLIATTAETRYTDTDYIANAGYEVRIVRRYDGYDSRISAAVAAAIVNMKAPEKLVGVNYTVEEQKQSEYLNKLYGGDYTFSTEARIPDGTEIAWRAMLGEVDLCSYGLEPINFNNGNFLLTATDGSWADLGQTTLSIERTYNAQSPDADGVFGAKWSSVFNEHLVLYTEGDVLYCSESGAQIAFRYTENGYTGGESQRLTLTTTENEYLVKDSDGVIHAFTGAGLLKYIENPDGGRITISRDEDGLITGLTLPSGKTLNIECNEDGHIVSIATLGGSALKYTYENDKLTSFTDVDGSVTRYVYDGKGRMTEWYDAEGNRQVKNTFDEDDRVIHQIDANGGEYELEYFGDHTVITDTLGNTSEVWFDAAGRTVRSVDALGGVTSYEYSAEGYISAQTDAAGLTTKYEYDENGNKTKEIFSDGSEVCMEYDGDGHLLKLTDQFGSSTLYEYDDSGNKIKQTNADGGVLTWEYDEYNRVIKAVDALGGETEYEYDGVNLARLTDANGNVTLYKYDDENRLISQTDALGGVTKYAYDAAGNLESLSFADGTGISYAYDAMGRVISQTDPEGAETEYEYDALGNLLRTIYPDGTSTESVYDLSGNVVSSIDALGARSENEYDVLGNLVKGTDANGSVYLYEYDSAGRITGETLPTGAKREYSYDGETGFLTKVVNEAGIATRFVYDAAGRMTESIASDGGRTLYEYNAMGYLSKATAPNGAETLYEYDLNGNLIKSTDANGNVTSYTYDALGNLLTVTDALGGTVSYTYDKLSCAVAVTDANGNTTSYEYDATGSLVSSTDPLGNEEEYSYNKNGDIIATTDALGGKVALTRDSMGQITGTTGKNGAEYISEYDAMGRVISETDALGNITRYEYDALGNLTKITDALDNATEIVYDELGNVLKSGELEYSYDAAGRQVTSTEAGTTAYYSYDEYGNLASTSVNGSETRYEYDLSGNVTAVTDAEGRRIELVYDLLGQISEIIYPDGTKDSFEYDALGRMTKQTPAAGVEISYTYDALGNMLTETEGEHVTSYAYDALGRCTSVTYPDGSRYEAEYDALGNIVSETDALGNATGYEYDAESLLTAVIYADGTRRSLSYDLLGRVTAETDELGETLSYAYDALGRISATTDALGGKVSYEYDSAGNAVAVTDANGNTTSYTYDAANRLTSETDALGNTVKYAYTPEGWLESVTNADGTVISYSYDKTGNMVGEDRGGEENTSVSYNELGQLTTVTTADGDTLYQYNEQGLLISVTAPDGSIVAYEYDEYGRQTKLTYPDGESVKYSYDEMDRLTIVKGLDGSKTKYSYDANGQRTETRGDKADTTYTYDALGQLVEQTTTGAKEISFAYAYDAAGRIISESRTEDGSAVESSYTYDAIGQLTSFTKSDGYSESYTYDAAGNMTGKVIDGLSVKMSYNAGNQLVRMSSNNGTISYTYDENGNLTEKKSELGTDTYTYDVLGRLSSYTGYDGYSQSYKYNAMSLMSEKTAEGNANRLTQEEYVSGRTLADSAEQEQNSTSYYTWDITREYGVLLSETTDGETVNYDYGLERISALNGSRKTEYIYDGRGSVAVTLEYTDAWYTLGGALSKATAISTVYSPFGEQLTAKRSGFGYNAELCDAALGSVYLRARSYEPAMNRFAQKDIERGAVTEPQSLNRYLYTQNDPVNFIDPSGERQARYTGTSKNTSITTSRITANTSKATTRTSYTANKTATSSARTNTRNAAGTYGGATRTTAYAAKVSSTKRSTSQSTPVKTKTTQSKPVSGDPYQQYLKDRQQSKVPSYREYEQLLASGLKMSYSQYVKQKSNSQFPSYNQYLNQKQSAAYNYGNYSSSKAVAAQMNASYARSSGVVAYSGAPSVTNLNIGEYECGDQKEIPEIHALGAGDYGFDRETANELIKFAKATGVVLKTLASSVEITIGVGQGLGFSGEAGVGAGKYKFSAQVVGNYIELRLDDNKLSFGQSFNVEIVLEILTGRLGLSYNETSDLNGNKSIDEQKSFLGIATRNSIGAGVSGYFIIGGSADVELNLVDLIERFPNMINEIREIYDEK